MKTLFGLVLVAAFGFLAYLALQITRSDEVSENEPALSSAPSSNVKMVEGKQVVEIKAKGGYLPRVSVVEAGVPTILRFNTAGTFDCSSVVSIPSRKITKTLPASGSTDIDLGILEEGILKGSCGMGMYPFELRVVNKDE